MTLNVIVENLVAVDCEASYHGARTSDDFEKSELFNRNNYGGVIIGNGSGLHVLNAFSFIRNNACEELDQLMLELEKDLNQREDKRYRDYLHEVEDRMRVKYSTIADTERREAHIVRDFGEQVDKLYETGNQSNGYLYVVAFDRKSNRLRKYALANRKGTKISDFDLIHVLADGSGGDLAGAYLATHTSGIDWSTIKPTYTFYLVSLACAAATANTGVGGYMQIITVDKDGAKLVDAKKANAAVRVCSKQIAGDISKKRAMELVGKIYEGSADFVKIAQSLNITLNDLLYLPSRLHQDVSKFNRMAVLKKVKSLDID